MDVPATGRVDAVAASWHVQPTVARVRGLILNSCVQPTVNNLFAAGVTSDWCISLVRKLFDPFEIKQYKQVSFAILYPFLLCDVINRFCDL